MRHVIAFLTAARIGVDRLGPSAMLVVQSGNLSFDGFELMNAGALGSDPKLTLDLCERLRVLRAKAPQPDP